MKQKMPKYYPIVKQVHTLREFCTVNRPPNPPESFVIDFCHARNCSPLVNATLGHP